MQCGFCGRIGRVDDRNQATFLNALLTLSLTRSAVSRAAFWARLASSLLWAVRVSNCLRACAVDSSTKSENDFAFINSLAKSKAALVLTRAASITLNPYSEAPLLAVA